MKDISAVTFAVQSFVTLFVIMDPPGATPIFLGLVADKSPRVRRILAVQAAGVSLLVISIFALFGRAILNYLNIDTTSMALGLVAAVIAVHVAIAAALMASTTILNVIKESGVTLVARIAGLLLAAIAVQMLVDAIRVFVAS